MSRHRPLPPAQRKQAIPPPQGPFGLVSTCMLQARYLDKVGTPGEVRKRRRLGRHDTAVFTSPARCAPYNGPQQAQTNAERKQHAGRNTENPTELCGSSGADQQRAGAALGTHAGPNHHPALAQHIQPQQRSGAAERRAPIAKQLRKDGEVAHCRLHRLPRPPAGWRRFKAVASIRLLAGRPSECELHLCDGQHLAAEEGRRSWVCKQGRA